METGRVKVCVSKHFGRFRDWLECYVDQMKCMDDWDWLFRFDGNVKTHEHDCTFRRERVQDKKRRVRQQA